MKHPVWFLFPVWTPGSRREASQQVEESLQRAGYGTTVSATLVTRCCYAGRQPSRVLVSWESSGQSGSSLRLHSKLGRGPHAPPLPASLRSLCWRLPPSKETQEQEEAQHPQWQPRAERGSPKWRWRWPGQRRVLVLAGNEDRPCPCALWVVCSHPTPPASH